jgi:hypothetical protein
MIAGTPSYAVQMADEASGWRVAIENPWGAAVLDLDATTSD